MPQPSKHSFPIMKLFFYVRKWRWYCCPSCASSNLGTGIAVRPRKEAEDPVPGNTLVQCIHTCCRAGSNAFIQCCRAGSIA